jgi:hypothetical protein
VPNMAPSKPTICRITRSWSSGYDRRLPSDGPGFNSRRTQHFFTSPGSRRARVGRNMFIRVGRNRFILLFLRLKLETDYLSLFSPVLLQEEPSPASWIDHTAAKQKKDPRNRSRTSDLEISIVAIYSLPLCQLSYTRTYESVTAGRQK